MHRATAIFAQGVGSACVWLSRLWDEKRQGPLLYPGERLPIDKCAECAYTANKSFPLGENHAGPFVYNCKLLLFWLLLYR